MPNTYTRLIGHLVFSTKYRQATLPPQARPRLYEYVAGTIRNLDGKLIIANGTHDHVHILTHYPARLSMAELVKKIKVSSSSWLPETRMARLFSGWQVGYCGLSVGYSQVDVVRRYIENQEEHHRTVSYQDEVRTLLNEAGVEFNEEYLW